MAPSRKSSHESVLNCCETILQLYSVFVFRIALPPYRPVCFYSMSTAQRQHGGLDPHHVGKRCSPQLIFRTRINVEKGETQLLHHRLI